MDDLAFVQNYLKGSIKTKNDLLIDSIAIGNIAILSDKICSAYRNGNKLLLAGNGGSAADCQHIAAEFVSRFFFDRPGLPAVALSTDTSILTAVANDYGYDHLFARQLQAQGLPGDIFIGISTSGNSKNIISAIKLAKTLGVYSVAFCGLGGEIGELADFVIRAPSASTPYIQECHICIGHTICALVEDRLFRDGDLQI